MFVELAYVNAVLKNNHFVSQRTSQEEKTTIMRNKSYHIYVMFRLSIKV